MRALWLASLMLCATSANARPYTVEDMLKLQSYGTVSIDPAERWAVIERRRPYNSARRYDLEIRTEHVLSELYVVNLGSPDALEPAFPQDPGAGYRIAGFSPSGRRLAILRITDEGLSYGILEMLTREVRWLEGAVDPLEASPRPIWLDDENLIFTIRTHGDLPVRYSSGEHAQLMAKALARSREGRMPAVRVTGSGAYRDLSIADDIHTVVRVNLRSGATEEIERGVITDLALSADRRKLAILEAGPSIQPYLDRPVDPGFQARRRRLVVEDLASGEQVEPCPSCDALPYFLVWSPRGAELLFYARRDDAKWGDGQLYRFADRRAVPLLPPGLRPPVSIVSGSAPTIRAGWAGDIPIIWAQHGTGVASWFRLEQGGPSPLPLQEADQLLLASPDTIFAIANGELVRLRKGVARERVLTQVAGITPKEQADYMSLGVRLLLNPRFRELPAVRVRRGATQQVIGIHPRTAEPAWSISIPADSAVVATSTRSGVVLYLKRDHKGVQTLQLATPRIAARRLDSINRHLADVDVPERTVIRSTAKDGHQRTHWLTLPKGSGPSPLVVLPYPGLERGDTPAAIDLTDFRSYLNVPLLVSAGYAVLEPSIPTESATDRRRTDFEDVGTMTEAARVPDDFETDDLLGDITAAVLGATDAAIATGQVDPERLALYGHSYGGYAVVGIATRTNRFDAVVASAGAYNLLGGYGAMHVWDAPELGPPTGMFSWFEAGQGGLGVPPWREIQGYVSRSPYFAVEHIQTPVMLVHGEIDFVPVEEAEQMFMALHRLGRDALLVRYAGEGHNTFSPANVRDRWSRIAGFLDRNFQGAPDQSAQ